MFDRVWELLRNSESLLDEAWRDSLGMLTLSRQMYEMVTQALTEQTSERVLAQVAQMDRELNASQREVRKKVFQHLAVSRGSDILRGLELAAIVIDLERIGDYSKNIAELPDMLRSPMEFGRFHDAYQRVHELVAEMFELTQSALASHSVEMGKEAMDLYPEVSRICDRTTREVITGGGAANEQITRSHLGLVLLMRYLKRVAAHLKNACSAIVNPFHQIGFRDGLG